MNINHTLRSQAHPEKELLGFRSKKRKLRISKSGRAYLPPRKQSPASNNGLYCMPNYIVG